MNNTAAWINGVLSLGTLECLIIFARGLWLHSPDYLTFGSIFSAIFGLFWFISLLEMSK